MHCHCMCMLNILIRVFTMADRVRANQYQYDSAFFVYGSVFTELDLCERAAGLLHFNLYPGHLQSLSKLCFLLSVQGSCLDW